MNTRTIRDPIEIRSILCSPEWTVKQKGHEVPGGLRNSIAGDIYQSFARMTDGHRHQELRSITEELIAVLDMNAIPDLVARAMPQFDEPTPRDMQYLLPGMVVAGLYGVPVETSNVLVNLVRDFVIGSRETAGAAENETVIAAIEQMQKIVKYWPSTSIDTDILASRIALLYQSSDAAAALVGNALIAVVERPAAEPESIVHQSMSNRVSVRMTTRVCGDDRVILDFEAAHGVEPESRWTFGHGAHRCPGSELAISIAVEIIRYVQKQHAFDVSHMVHNGWEPLPNVWIPVLGQDKGGQE